MRRISLRSIAIKRSVVSDEWTRPETLLLRLVVAGALGVAPASSFGAKTKTKAPPVVEWSAPVDVEPLGGASSQGPAPAKTLSDTIWIAEWTFDAGGACTASGWTTLSGDPPNGTVFWNVTAAFAGVGGVSGNAAALGYTGNACCVDLDGYDNDWYQAIRIPYSGAGTVSFDYLVDSEAGYDFLQVEADSACASFARAVATRPASFFRRQLYSDTGLELAGHVGSLALPDFATSATHCLYIAFFSDGGYSPCDGYQPTTIGRALVVDNLHLAGVTQPVDEDFDGPLDPAITFADIQDTSRGGIWARLFPHVSDNDLCTENTSCAWIFTDPDLVCIQPDVGFGPEHTVVSCLIDNSILSPWVSLASTPGPMRTLLSFREFGGQPSISIVRNWSVRSRIPSPGDPAGCTRGFGHASDWSALRFLGWKTQVAEVSPYLDPAATEIQVRYRVASWSLIGGGTTTCPDDCLNGPGPFVDHVRIGRQVITGPVIREGIDSRTQGQDCFPTEIDPNVTPAGEHYRPTTDRFGTCAFSEGTELTVNRTGPNLVTGDSVNVTVVDSRGTGGITSVQFSGAIVAGPHAGKAPAPYSVTGNGFFVTNADSSRTAGGTAIANRYFRDLDDTYFRGGDVLHYFWAATDAGGGFSSDPDGLTAAPASIAAAEAATGGLFETSFLPAIAWAPAYLDRIAADPNGDLAPTPAELAASAQKNCMLYVNHINSRRRSGDVNRTSFMYTLDNLGYRGTYDVYDHQGMGNTNNHLGGRATIQQAQGYNLIVYDAGNAAPGRPIMPNGTDLDAEKIDQATWFRNWLAQAALPGVDFATLWVIGANALEEKPTNLLYTGTMGATLAATNQGLGVNPDVAGQGSFTFDNGSGSSAVSFTTGRRAAFSLNGGCPDVRNYDALSASAPAARVYRYRHAGSGTLGHGAIVMNGNAAEHWNTILMSFPWFDIRQPVDRDPSAPDPEVDLLAAILGGVLPGPCLRSPNPVDVSEDPRADGLPGRTVLFQNVPNPFNPVTTIRFDLAREGRVRLRIYDIGGRLVRTLVDARVVPGYHPVTWDGLDDAGMPVSSGIYIYRLETDDTSGARKMVVLR